MQELNAELKLWNEKVRATKKEIQSLTGKLNFVVDCVKSSHIYFSRIINLLKDMKSWGSTKVPESVWEDIWWWMSFHGVGCESVPHEN